MANEPNVRQIMRRLQEAINAPRPPRRTDPYKRNSRWYFILGTFYPKNQCHVGVCRIKAKSKVKNIV